MIDRKPNLAAYARVSYLRELHGDLEGAAAAMRLAVAAGGPAPENNAYVLALLGELERRRGRAAAGAAVVRHGARARAALRGRGGGPGAASRAPRRRASPRAIARLRGVVDTLPLPEYVVALGETQLAAGDTAAARRTSRWSRPSSSCSAPPESTSDVELAVFEADHGSPAQGGRRSPGADGRRRRACARPTRSAGR